MNATTHLPRSKKLCPQPGRNTTQLLPLVSSLQAIIRRLRRTLGFGFVFLVLTSTGAFAENGREAWLRYQPLSPAQAARFQSFPNSVVVLGDSAVLESAESELVRAVRGMLGRSLQVDKNQPEHPAIVLGTLAALKVASPQLKPPEPLRADSFWITSGKVGGFGCLIVAASNDRGVLYGVFELLRQLALGKGLELVEQVQQPYAPLRWINQWDNLDGRIERGYAGRSIVFENDRVRADLTRASEYARLLASIGINGCTVNNVNADPRLLTPEFLRQLARIAAVFRPWGLALSLSVDFSSPKVVGGLDSFDPLDPRVQRWWNSKVDEIYRVIPDFGGFVVKADSEGRLGPAIYGRTPANAANVLARALKPHGGIVFYRAFVYNHHLDWRDWKNDRAKAAYDNFHPLDGKFDDNVIIQIKNGPIDFQVREPVSPLFGGLEKTNEAIELQITQEYLGQQRHLCFLPSMWKEILDFDLHADHRITLTKEVVSGRTFHRPTGGFVGVANVGTEDSWLGHPLAMANLYGFGRLAWNPDLTARAIVEEWTRLTFGSDPLVVNTIVEMQLASWNVYETYTGPLGAGTLTNILAGHYGPGIESSEGNGWGQWHRADHGGIGMDRTTATGTGYTAQYSPEVGHAYEVLKTTPDAVLLFFHHVPYTYVLQSGETVIQHIYDSHYDGAERTQQFVEHWKRLKGRIDDERYRAVLDRLEYQSGHAIVWRDAICEWFFRISGIADLAGRVGHYPGRVEAEAMRLTLYDPVDVTPWETASGGKAVECKRAAKACAAEFTFDGQPGSYLIQVQYFDQAPGEAKYRVLGDGEAIDQWTGNDHLPGLKIGGDTSTRRYLSLVLHPGEKITIEGTPDGDDPAALDYVEIHPSPSKIAKLPPEPVHLTAEQDHRRTMDLLGISSLRPGPSGNPASRDAANVDESKVAPYQLPDPLTLKDGTQVNTAEMWWKKRRPEIVEDFDREIYGRVPNHIPNVNWEVANISQETNGDLHAITKKLIGHLDNSAYPFINVDIELSLTTPAKATDPVPVIMEFGFNPEVLAAMARRFPALRVASAGPTWQQQVLAKGWAYAILVPTSIQADNGEGLTQGIIGLLNKGQPRGLDDWGTLRAWAWGASRALDYFQSERSVDAKRVAIEGLSRYGKAALVTMAYDPRFAIGFIGSSGEGGAKILRRKFGEQVENLASANEYHWMAGNFLKYAGPLTPNDLPVDAHELIALCAPRPLFISSGSPTVEGGWVDAKGMFLGGVGAGPVYRLLGKKDLGTAEFPPIETALTDGDIAFRSHNAGHTTGPNWPTFLTFAERYFKSNKANGNPSAGTR